MISKLLASIKLQGADFSPSTLSADLAIDFNDQNEKGDLAKYGRYAESGYPFGWANIVAPESVDQFDSIYYLAKLVRDARPLFDKHGIDDRYLYVGYFYEDQCNFEFSEEEINMISEAGLSFGISCYDVTEDNK